MPTVALAPGMVTDRRTAHMLAEAERLFGRTLYYAQGSWSHAQASGSTHAGSGAVDVRTVPLGGDHKAKMRLVRALREVGFAAWYREYTPGLWGEHIHAIAIGAPGLSSGAAWQVAEYRAGRDGLTGRRPDPNAAQWDDYGRTWEKYKHANPKVTKATGARVWGTPYVKSTKAGRRKRGERVPVDGHRAWLNRRGKPVTWLRLHNGRWVKAKRTDWRG